MHFLSENTKSMPQSKQSDQHSTSNTCNSCGQWFSCQCFFPNSFFLAERGWKWRENYRWPAEKAKVKVNMDCFSLIKGQWKVREFLSFWWVATLLFVKTIKFFWPCLFLILVKFVSNHFKCKLWSNESRSIFVRGRLRQTFDLDEALIFSTMIEP